MPNAWDAGSTRIIAGAIGTTSAGHAATLDRAVQHVGLDELSAHATELVAAVDVPISVDAERCFADTPDGVATTVEQLATTGASGVSMEDYHPTTGIDQSTSPPDVPLPPRESANPRNGPDRTS